jgi:hypothetical protein
MRFNRFPGITGIWRFGSTLALSYNEGGQERLGVFHITLRYFLIPAYIYILIPFGGPTFIRRWKRRLK